MAYRILVPIGMALALSACGQKAELTPLASQELPPRPYGAEVQPDAEDLLALDPQAAPDRSVELRTRSEEREDDPFDLPPEEVITSDDGDASRDTSPRT